MTDLSRRSSRGATADLELTGVRVDRAGRCVLEVPSLRVPGGQTTAILGPNGSGKTTLLRVIAGLERTGAGAVRVGGAVVQTGRDVAFVFQEHVFLRDSVRANLALGPTLRGVARADIEARVREAASILEIEHLLDRRADRLSGGEGRRVSLARALCLRAPLVLLDEPLAGLDDRTYSHLLDQLPRILAAFSATTFVVTHNRDEALRLARRLVVLVDGRVNANGDTAEVAANPRTAAVAEVLGYAIVDLGDRKIAIPRDSLRSGPGPLEFSVVVDDVFDLVESLVAVGQIGETRVQLRLPATSEVPARGDRLRVHTERWYDLA